MSRERAWADEYTLLCERCGYALEGLDPAGTCPECAKPIAESLPERRTGTPWQRDPSTRAWARTALATLLHPNKTLERLHADTERASAGLLWCYVLFASLCVPIGPVLFGVYSFISVAVVGGGDFTAMYLAYSVMIIGGGLSAGLFAVPLLWFLTWIETRGLIFFGASRGVRLTRAYALAITAHAGGGWAIAGLGVLIGAVLVSWGLAVRAGYTAPDYDPFLASALVGTGLGVGTSLAIAGFMFFECFAYLGARWCRFANRTRPDAGTSS